jgi:hypothetical protein
VKGIENTWTILQLCGDSASCHIGGMKEFDPISVFGNCIRDPQQMQPTMDHFQEMMQNAAKKK